MKLVLDTKIEFQEIEQKDGSKMFHLGAFITKASFDSMTIENPTTQQMVEITQAAAGQWLDMSVGEKDILGAVEFAPAIPPHLRPNIAVCYNNKFHVNNHPRGEVVAEKITAARDLDGYELYFEFTAENLQLVIPTENVNETVQNLHVATQTSSQPIDIHTVPLSSYNIGSNLLSLRLDEMQSEELLRIAAMVTGSIETAMPTNSMNQQVPFSFTLAKMPNLLNLVLEQESKNQNCL